MAEVLSLLRETGPSLGRPVVDRVSGSDFPNLKELRTPGTNLRVLFAFDPLRRAILRVGGDKTNDWLGWYKRNIPIAERRYREHREQIERGE